ncbi:MAG: hypothetical protein ACI936_003289 [Paraglaciecola sp.]
MVTFGAICDDINKRIHDCDVWGIRDEILLEANEYIVTNNNKVTVVTLKNASALEPHNPKIRMLLGKLYVDMDFFVDAEKELSRASDLGVSEDLVTPLLVKAFYYQ